MVSTSVAGIMCSKLSILNVQIIFSGRSKFMFNFELPNPGNEVTTISQSTTYKSGFQKRNGL